ncbi:MAG: hypothetical protein V4510_05425 [bacterium]
MRLWPLAFLVVLAVPAAAAQPAHPVVVEVDLLVISFGNYDANKGTYTMDLYLHLSYDAMHSGGIDPTHFEFVNGRAASKELQSDDTNATTGIRDLWYRLQVNLYAEPHFENYPYDAQILSLQLEDAVHTDSELVYRDALTGTGIDPDIHVAGWRIDNAGATVAPKVYAFGETYSRFAYQVQVSREPLSATLRAFLPPLAFMIVSALSFFLHASKVAQRLTLGTSMLIAAVGFHISQTVSLPTLGRLTLFDQLMLAAYAFLAASLAVTALVAYNEDFRKDDKTAARSTRINVRGAVLAAALPVLVFLALRFL